MNNQSKGKFIAKTAVKGMLLDALVGAFLGIIFSAVRGSLIGALIGTSLAGILGIVIGKLVSTKQSRALWLGTGFAIPGAIIGAVISTWGQVSGAGAMGFGMLAVTLGFSVAGTIILSLVFLVLGLVVGTINVMRNRSSAMVNWLGGALLWRKGRGRWGGRF